MQRKISISNQHTHRRSSAPRQVRIIGGIWKRTNLPVLEAAGLRPTPDRVRETVFNWINHIVDQDWSPLTVLDLFAGTGALGFEAASRGATSVTMVDAYPPVIQQLHATKTKLQAEQVTILHGDACAMAQTMAKRRQRFNMIFLDPPYQQGWLSKIWPSCTQLLAEDGLLYVESGMPLQNEMAATPDYLADWEIVRADQAGNVFYHLLQRKKAT